MLMAIDIELVIIVEGGSYKLILKEQDQIRYDRVEVHMNADTCYVISNLSNNLLPRHL